MENVGGGEVFEERFESDGAAAYEPGVDLEDPVKCQSLRNCKNVKRWNAVSRRSGVDGEYMVEKE